MKTLKEYILNAESKQIAVGHFNISNLEGLKAVTEAAKELSLPVIVGVSEGERKYVGVQEISALVKVIRERTGAPIFLNADHTHSFESAKEAIDAGFDSITADGSSLSLTENIAFVKSVVAYARAQNREVVVEGELGFIGNSSEVRSVIPEGVLLDESSLTKPDIAAELVRESACDMLAPAVGNVHGMIGVGLDPKLNINRIAAIKDAVGVPIVLHGASGNSDEDIRGAIVAGVSVVHINTELRAAFRKGLERGLSENKDEVAPYKYTEAAIEDMKKVVTEKLKLFNNII